MVSTDITTAGTLSTKATKALDTMRARIVKADAARTAAAHEARAVQVAEAATAAVSLPARLSLIQFHRLESGMPNRLAALLPPIDSLSLTASTLNSSVYCRFGTDSLLPIAPLRPSKSYQQSDARETRAESRLGVAEGRLACFPDPGQEGLDGMWGDGVALRGRRQTSG